MQPETAEKSPTQDLPRETGGFRLLRTLGRGGMGVVYEAEELKSGRRVALKVLARELSVSDEAFERFRREARIAASVSDSACVFVFGAHQVDGSPAISMELCPGETLEHRLRQKEPVPIADAVRWTIEILDGLEAAHASGIVHRDVKPSNCFTTADGHVKVGDFGLSRSLAEDVQLTQSGVFLGSPLYASPEQIKGRTVDFKSDLYSVGATLYALLVGRAPYRGTNIGEVLARILSDPPDSLVEQRKDVPPALEKVVLRSMARDPAARYPSHAAMRDALRPFAGGETKAAGPLRRFGAYLIDGAIIGLLHAPLMGFWTRFDPGSFVQVGRFSVQVQSPRLQLAMVLTGMVYFSLSEGLFRRTIGKWLTGQRVVVVAPAGASSPGPYFRAVIWNTPGVLFSLARFLPAHGVWVQLALGAGPVMILAALAMVSTMRARNGWRGVHEFASRTRVVAEPLPFVRLVERREPPPSKLEPADLAPSRFGEYIVRGRVGRTPSAEIFEASDPQLDRRVWILSPLPGAAGVQAARRSLDRPMRLRWLDAIDVDGRRCEVFEAPGGARLRDCAAGRSGVDWPTTYRALTMLADELSAPDAQRVSLDQLWLDRSWNLRILDEPLQESRDRTAEASEEPLRILAQLTRTCAGASAGPSSLPPDLPEHADPVVRSLLGVEAPFGSLADARRALAGLAGHPQGLTWKIRGLQLLIGSGIVSAFAIVMVIGVTALGLPMMTKVEEGREALRELKDGRLFTLEEILNDDGVPKGPELSEEQKEDRRRVVAAIVEQVPAFGQRAATKLSPEDQKLVGRTREELASLSPAEIAAAQARVRADRPEGFDIQDTELVRAVRIGMFGIPAFFAVFFALWSVFFAFVLRGGVSMRFLSVAVRDSRGAKAGRFRCAWRALVTVAPFVVLYAIPLALMFRGHPALAAVALGAAVVAQAGLVLVALRNPVRGWQDRVAGTRLVPR